MIVEFTGIQLNPLLSKIKIMSCCSKSGEKKNFFLELLTIRHYFLIDGWIALLLVQLFVCSFTFMTEKLTLDGKFAKNWR